MYDSWSVLDQAALESKLRPEPIRLFAGRNTGNGFLSNQNTGGTDDPKNIAVLSPTEEVTIHHWRARASFPNDGRWPEYEHLTLCSIHLPRQADSYAHMIRAPLYDLLDIYRSSGDLDIRAPIAVVPPNQPLEILVNTAGRAWEPIVDYAELAREACDAGHGHEWAKSTGFRYRIWIHLEGIARTV